MRNYIYVILNAERNHRQLCTCMILLQCANTMKWVSSLLYSSMPHNQPAVSQIKCFRGGRDNRQLSPLAVPVGLLVPSDFVTKIFNKPDKVSIFVTKYKYSNVIKLATVLPLQAVLI